MGDLNYHIIWGTKYRRKMLFSPRVIKELGLSLAGECEKRGWTLYKFNVGQENHVHVLLIDMPPTVSVSYIKQIVKGTTSYYLRHIFPMLKGMSKDALWQRGAKAYSVGQNNLNIVARYIDNQQINELRKRAQAAEMEIKATRKEKQAKLW